MKNIKLIIILVVLLLAVILIFFSRSDYHGEIGRLEENKFVLYPLKVNPAYEHVTPEVYFSKDTKITGKIRSVEELKNGHIVKIWVDEKDGKEFARNIKVIKEESLE